MAKKRNDYFEMIKHQVSYSVKASNLLGEILCLKSIYYVCLNNIVMLEG